MTLRPNNLITQQVERMRNLNYVFSECKVIKKKEERQDFINKNFGNLRYFL